MSGVTPEAPKDAQPGTTETQPEYCMKDGCAGLPKPETTTFSTTAT